MCVGCERDVCRCIWACTDVLGHMQGCVGAYTCLYRHVWVYVVFFYICLTRLGSGFLVTFDFEVTFCSNNILNFFSQKDRISLIRAMFIVG